MVTSIIFRIRQKKKKTQKTQSSTLLCLASSGKDDKLH